MDTWKDFSQLPLKVTGISNQAYHSVKEFDSRSLILSVASGGGESQLWQDKGYSIWAGSSAASLGTDFDTLIEGTLQGKKFDDMIVVPPEDVLGANGSKSTKAFKEWAAQQTALIATEEQRWKFAKMYESMLRNDAAYGLMKETTETQVSVFFEVGGHKVKVRPDACTPTRWWDLKTTSAPWDQVYRSVVKYGYPEQEWLYVQGAMALGYEHFRMPFVFVQTMPPFSCHCYYLPEMLVELAGRRMLSVMEDMRLRRSTGSYLPPGVIEEMEVPAWAMKQEEEVVL